MVTIIVICIRLGLVCDCQLVCCVLKLFLVVFYFLATACHAVATLGILLVCPEDFFLDVYFHGSTHFQTIVYFTLTFPTSVPENWWVDLTKGSTAWFLI